MQTLETLAISPRNKYPCAKECDQSEKRAVVTFLISDGAEDVLRVSKLAGFSDTYAQLLPINTVMLPRP